MGYLSVRAGIQPDSIKELSEYKKLLIIFLISDLFYTILQDLFQPGGVSLISDMSIVTVLMGSFNRHGTFLSSWGLFIAMGPFLSSWDLFIFMGPEERQIKRLK
ncbi:hypothetical protein PRIPAC_77819, partial [Pristionchus pacificus]|uniref:Uncharacterized protein n=1 Tax=Pristionchus pacificus TaxID=54126 RepID=A0A2A6CKH1_PRIPA